MAGNHVTAAGTDFSTWKRENLEKLAAELTAEVIKIREQLYGPKVLYWTFDGEGQWEATSRYHDDGIHFIYRIGVCDDGSFDVSESDPEMLGRNKKPNCFPTLLEAQHYCEFLERSY